MANLFLLAYSFTPILVDLIFFLVCRALQELLKVKFILKGEFRKLFLVPLSLSSPLVFVIINFTVFHFYCVLLCKNMHVSPLMQQVIHFMYSFVSKILNISQKTLLNGSYGLFIFCLQIHGLPLVCVTVSPINVLFGHFDDFQDFPITSNTFIFLH